VTDDVSTAVVVCLSATGFGDAVAVSVRATVGASLVSSAGVDGPAASDAQPARTTSVATASTDHEWGAIVSVRELLV